MTYSSQDTVNEALRLAMRRGDVRGLLKYLEEVCCNNPIEVQAAAASVGLFYLYGHDRFVTAREFIKVVEAESEIGASHRWDKSRLSDAMTRVPARPEGADA